MDCRKILHRLGRLYPVENMPVILDLFPFSPDPCRTPLRFVGAVVWPLGPIRAFCRR